MLIFKYRAPTPELVKFNRIVSAFILIVALFSEHVSFLYIFTLINTLTLIVGMKYALSSLIYNFFEQVLHVKICDVNFLYKRSYYVDHRTERFEIIMRVLVGAFAMLIYEVEPMVAWLLIIFMAIFMLISSFFGFCLSALAYVAYKYIKGMFYVKR